MVGSVRVHPSGNLPSLLSQLRVCPLPAPIQPAVNTNQFDYSTVGRMMSRNND